MVIKVTLGEILDAPLIGSWDEFCEAQGFDPWCISEGGDQDHEVEITIKQAQRWGLLDTEEA